MLAASVGEAEVVDRLLKHRADVTLRDWKGRTAIDYAAKDSDHRITQLLQ
jgi:ankyrin repeat protein